VALANSPAWWDRAVSLGSYRTVDPETQTWYRPFRARPFRYVRELGFPAPGPVRSREPILPLQASNKNRKLIRYPESRIQDQCPYVQRYDGEIFQKKVRGFSRLSPISIVKLTFFSSFISVSGNCRITVLRWRTCALTRHVRTCT
jgi:hypothetical protein